MKTQLGPALYGPWARAGPAWVLACPILSCQVSIVVAANKRRGAVVAAGSRHLHHHRASPQAKPPRGNGDDGNGDSDGDDYLLHLQSYPQSLPMDEDDYPEPNPHYDLLLNPPHSCNPNSIADKSPFSSLLFCDPNEDEEAADGEDDEIDGNEDHKPFLDVLPSFDSGSSSTVAANPPGPSAPHMDPFPPVITSTFP